MGMASCWPRTVLTVALLSTIVLVHAAQGSGQRSKEAYVSLLYGDAFLLGIRVLGQSLRETGTKRDLLAVTVGSHVSQEAKDTLRSDGWLVQEVDAIQNPGLWSTNKAAKFPARFWAVYTKLLVFNLTQYERVVYLDADTIALQSLDPLFLCDGLCGVMRHSERLNSGVMVLQPNATLFDDMMTRISSTPSYTGGDQGFLNAYFAGFAGAPLFDPEAGKRLSELPNHVLDANPAGPATDVKMGRLPTEYNADLGLFILNSNRWMVPESQLKVLHYTISSFKPWNWWSSWIISDTMNVWQSFRRRLPPPQTAPTTSIYLIAQLLFPLAVGMLFVRRCRSLAGCVGFLVLRKASGTTAVGVVPHVGGALPWLTLATAVACLLTSLGLTISVVVPGHSAPIVGWMLAYEWTAFLFTAFFGGFLYLVYRRGKGSPCVGSASQDGEIPHPKSSTVKLGRAWLNTVLGFAMTFVLLGLLPWWSTVFRLPSFTARVLCVGVMSAPTCLIIGQLLTTMAAVWFGLGQAEAQAGTKYSYPV